MYKPVPCSLFLLGFLFTFFYAFMPLFSKVLAYEPLPFEEVILSSPVTGTITAGWDGKFWFNYGEYEYPPTFIGNIALDGIISKFLVPDSIENEIQSISSLTQGSDGNMWFVSYAVTNLTDSVELKAWLHSISPNGSTHSYSLPNLPTDFYKGDMAVAGDSDSHIWIMTNNSILKFDINTHTFSTVLPPEDGISRYSLNYLTDGNVWFSSLESLGTTYSLYVNKLSPAGEITKYLVLEDDDFLPNYIGDIIFGPNATVWFSDYYGDVIGRLSLDGDMDIYPVPKEPDTYCLPWELVLGQDSNLWFNCHGNYNNIVRVTPDGSFTFYDAPQESVFYLAKGPDLNLWALDRNSPRLVRFSIITTTPTPTPSPTPAPNECGDILFMGARGSGNPGPGTSGWLPTSSDPHGLGGVVNYTYKQLLEKTGQHRKIVPFSVNYPAKGAETLLTAPEDYFNGLYNGFNFTTQKLKERSVICPNEQIVLAGYSQGAMVMHRALNQLSSNTALNNAILNRLTAVLLIADGDRVANERARNFGTMRKTTHGIGLELLSQSGSTDKKFPAALDSKKYVLQVCNKFDIVCDQPAPFVDYWSVHTHYVGNPALIEATDVAINLVLSRPLPPNPIHLTATKGVPFSYQLTAKIGSNYSLQWGLLPPSILPSGLSMDKDGLITGTPREMPTGITMVRVRSSILGVTGDWVPVTLNWN
jgi:streptogramin lyase